MGIDFYYAPASAPCRTILLTAEALGLKLNCKYVNTMEKEQLKPEFIKINPQHTIPTIDDDGYHLWESRAIVTYLVNKYGKNDSLYPKDPQKRGTVDQRLYFDMGTLYDALAECYYPVLMGRGPLDPENLKKVEGAVGFLDTFLENSEYAAGDQLTVADFCLVATVSTLDVIGFDMSPYKNVTRWFAKLKTTVRGYGELNDKNMDMIREMVNKMKQNK